MENIYNYLIVTNGDMTSVITSQVQDLSKTDGYSVYAKWTGSPIGAIELKASLDGINFVVIAGSATDVNGPGDALWEVTTAFYDKILVEYVPSGGSGTLNVQINGKGDTD
jgi:hypothetical protein